MISKHTSLWAFLLCLSTVIGCHAQVPGGKLPTRWDASVSPLHPLAHYPRPQMRRSTWENLNGPWSYALTGANAAAPPALYPGKILVPYPYESALSGVDKPSPVTQRLWYHRTFTIPARWRTGKQHILLHFGAVNWDSTVLVNGMMMGDHKGGYASFTDDITSALKPGVNDLVVSAWNPIKHDLKSGNDQVIGKQRRHPGGIFYTASTGIWQTVWLEPVPEDYIKHVVITPDIDASVLHLIVQTRGNKQLKVRAVATDQGQVVSTVTGPANSNLALSVPHERLWSPSHPHLYDLKITLLEGRKQVDRIGSYFGMRQISVGKGPHGTMRILLNNKFVFEHGVLDQGYWPDGEYTPPTDAAMRHDIVMTKRFGFNMCRKHAMVEPDRWYYWADKLGELVWQDMPQAFGSHMSDTAKAQFKTELTRLIQDRRNHPCIVDWTLFNEGWGQHDTVPLAAYIHTIDPTRLVDDASGWVDHGVGNIMDTHAYPGPWCIRPVAPRASIDGEFGGLTERVPGHMWTKDVFGYGSTLNNSWLVTDKYQQLLKTAYRLRQTRGMSGYVYTQLTDVEQESNGLMTYDRSVVKPITKIVTAANKGIFLSMPPAPAIAHILVPTSRNTPQTWHYTTTAHPPSGNWYTTNFDDSAWRVGKAPFGQGYSVNTAWTDTPGDIWIRRSFILPAVIPAHLNVVMEHDEDAQVYINGVLAASATGYNGHYLPYPISTAARATLHPGRNLLAVHCHQTVGGQVIDVGLEAASK